MFTILVFYMLSILVFYIEFKGANNFEVLAWAVEIAGDSDKGLASWISFGLGSSLLLAKFWIWLLIAKLGI